MPCNRSSESLLTKKAICLSSLSWQGIQEPVLCKVSVGRSLEIPRGRGGILKAKLLEEKYETSLEFPWRGGDREGAKNNNNNNKNFCGGGGYGYFLELHIEQTLEHSMFRVWGYGWGWVQGTPCPSNHLNEIIAITDCSN